jgi:hypothetical protein
MCEKQKFGNFRIDPCLQEIINQINQSGQYKTLLSCCGHNVYPKSIVCIDKNKRIFEWFSKIELPRYYKNGHIKRRYYKKDKKGYYYLPELSG